MYAGLLRVQLMQQASCPLRRAMVLQELSQAAQGRRLR